MSPPEALTQSPKDVARDLAQDVDRPGTSPRAPGVANDFAAGVNKALYYASLEWVPWPPNAVMDAARLGSIGIASHHLHKANQAALAVWKGCKNADPRIRLRTRARAAEIARELALGSGIARDAVPKTVENMIKERLVTTARPARLWNPLSWFQPSKAKLALAPEAELPVQLSRRRAARALDDAARHEVLKKATTDAAHLGLEEGEHFAARLLPGLTKRSSVLGWIGRQSARYTVGLQFLFSCHDVLQSGRIERDPRTSKTKRLLAHVTSLMSGIAIFAPVLPVAYRWPIVTATSAIGAITGTARDIVR
ncbi:MAG: hypothetical protein IPK13_14715 [Deltaproteobacteria bacterium]|nr:hypothetical protein [Deltaproteobacteria bacterium]